MIEIRPGYKCSTATTSYITYEIIGPGYHFFWDNVEVDWTMTAATI